MSGREIRERELRRNASGYSDPTAYAALKKEEEKERLSKLLSIIFHICEVFGFSVEERIVLRDVKSGRIWR